MRRRPPKQGELRADVSKATMFQGDRKVSKIFCPTFCALQKVGKRSRRKAAKGFNWVRAKPPLRRAESRFGKPRCSLQRERVVTFCVVQKVTKKHAGLRPATSIQISARYMIFAEVTGHHHVTGGTKICSVTGYRR